MENHKLSVFSLLIVFLFSIIFLTSCPQKESVEDEAKQAVTESNTESKTVETVEPKAKGDTESARVSNVPKFQGKNLADGSDVSSDNMGGYVLIIDFWASWCPPCRQEIPGFVELHNKYKDKKFSVIGISLDRTEAEAKSYVKNQKVNYPVIMRTAEIQRTYEKAIKQAINAIPTTVIINRKGEVSSVHIGYKPKEVFEEEIKKLL